MGSQENDEHSTDQPQRDIVSHQTGTTGMWPEPEFGFEADTFSPMGTAEREVRLGQGLLSLRHNKRALVTLGMILGGFTLLFFIGALASTA